MKATYLVALLAGLVASASTLEAQGGQVLRRAPPLDSAARAQQSSYEKALRELRASSPAAFDSTRALMALVTHMALGRLGYLSRPFDLATSPTLVSAIRAYERDRGLAVTGDPLNFELSASLRSDEQAFDIAPSLPTRAVSVTEDYAFLQGAWTFADMGDQSIAVEINCRRAERRCVESQAIYRASVLGSPMLTTDLQEWEIARWDNVEIATQPVDFTCARYGLRINIVQKTAVKVRSTISNAQACAHQIKDDLIITLSDGPTVAGEKARKKALDPFPALLSDAAATLLKQNVKAP